MMDWVKCAAKAKLGRRAACQIGYAIAQTVNLACGRAADNPRWTDTYDVYGENLRAGADILEVRGIIS
jgi:hypothetical protein